MGFTRKLPRSVVGPRAVGMVNRIVAVSFPQLWDNADGSVLLPAIGLCRIDSRVEPVGEGIEERIMTSSYAGQEKSIVPHGNGLAVSRP